MKNFFKGMFGTEQVRDTTGRLVGIIQHTPTRDIVREPSGPMNGFTQNGGTFDDTGHRLLSSEQPGFLLGRGEKKW